MLMPLIITLSIFISSAAWADSTDLLCQNGATPLSVDEFKISESHWQRDRAQNQCINKLNKVIKDGEIKCDQLGAEIELQYGRQCDQRDCYYVGAPVRMWYCRAQLILLCCPAW